MAATVIPLDIFNRLTPHQKIGAMATVALAIAILVGGWLWAQEPPYGVLFANLSEQDGGQVIAALEQQNIPYRVSDGGSAILIPVSRVHDVRLRLASGGIPKGGLVGFELMEQQKIGVSQFAEQINYQRALEGELARSIQSLAAVKGARVHLAIPKQTAFLRDDQKPTASILVSLAAGRTLESSQVAGIVHLVSSSVPQLNPAQVSVIDQNGNLLSQQNAKNAGLDPSQLKYVTDMEKSYIERIESILIPIVGAGNVRAQVAAEIDFSQIDQMDETFKPNPNPQVSVRSQQTAESGSGSGQPGALGVPGALTNQPPVPATAPITNPEVTGGGVGGKAGAGGGNFTRNATVNYEVDKTIKHTKGSPGVVRRLSVAVAVNHKIEPIKGKTIPLSEAEIKQVTALTQEAVGFSKARGDTLNVANVSFAPVEKTVIPDMPLWQQAWFIAMVKESARWLIYGLIVWFIWSKAVQPVWSMYAAAAERAREEEHAKAEAAKAEAAASAAGYVPERSYEEKLRQARELAKQDPKAVAGIIKEWVGGEPR